MIILQRYVCVETTILHKLNITQLKNVLFKREIKPHNIWNTDEKGFRLACGGKKKRVVQRFARREHGSKEPRKRESLTVVECMSPDGRYVTPLVIYMSKAGPLCGWFREERKEDYWYTTAEKGFNNTAIFVQWMKKVFEPETRPADPNEWRILIFDGFDAHLDPKVVDFAVDHKISCFSLPPHCTHEGQPLDKALFGPMAHEYSELVSKQHVQVDKMKFQQLYIEARQKVCTVENAKAGFRATGIHPFDPLKVLEKCRLEDPELVKYDNAPPPNTKQATSQELLQDCGSEFTPSRPPPDGVELEIYRKKALENILQLMEPEPPPQPRPCAVFTAAPPRPIPPVPRLLRTAHHINTITAAAQKAAADLQMSKAGESRLKDELCQRSEQQKADTRRIPNDDDTGSGSTDGGLKPRLAEELVKGNYLVERKRQRDQEEADGTWKKKKASQARTKRASKKTQAGKEAPPAQPQPAQPQPAQPQPGQFYYPTSIYPTAAQYPTIYYPQQPVGLPIDPQQPATEPLPLPLHPSGWQGQTPLMPLQVPPQAFQAAPHSQQPMAPLPPQSLHVPLQSLLQSLPPGQQTLPQQSLPPGQQPLLQSLPPGQPTLPQQSLPPGQQPILQSLPPGQQTLPKQPLAPRPKQPLAPRPKQPLAPRPKQPLAPRPQ
jgi:hypothetical protein